MLPNDIYSIIEPLSKQFLPHDWENEFAPYRWLYVAGCRRCMIKIGVYDLSAYADSEIIDNLPNKIPENWKLQFPNCKWKNRLSKTQIIGALKGKSSLTLDRACLVIAAMHDFLEKNGASIQNSSEYMLQIRPAVFRLPAFTEDFYKHHFKGNNNSEKFTDLKKHTGQSSSEFFEEISKGFGATYITLKLVAEFIKEEISSEFDNDITPVLFRSWNKRPDVLGEGIERRGMHPAKFEVISQVLALS